MKEIFQYIKVREWDWMGWVDNPTGQPLNKRKYWFDSELSKGLQMPQKLYISREGIINKNCNCNSPFVGQYTLADLLANKSWCKAVWGKGKPHNKTFLSRWEEQSSAAFYLLQTAGEKRCLEFIKETIL